MNNNQSDNNNGFPLGNDAFPGSNNNGNNQMNNNNRNDFGNPFSNSFNNNNFNYPNFGNDDMNNNSNKNNNNFTNNNNFMSNPFQNNMNNNMNNNFNNNSGVNPMMLTEMWKDKLMTYNAYLNEGKFTPNIRKLREGIKEILECLPNIIQTMEECNANGDGQGRQNLFRIKSDMEQTCWRFECMNHNKRIEPFRSAFEGNNRNYTFNKETLFKEQEYVPYNNVERENKTRTGIEKFGHAVKGGLISFGKAVKKTTVSGYNYVKEKLSDEPSNQQVSEDCYSYSKNPQITNKSYE